ncbi:MAG: WbqC family protein [Pseudomonadota bacterium]
MPATVQSTPDAAAPKRVGIMQPYFFPYFEQFRLIAACDLWVVFDTAQYTRKSWMTRNRILNRDKGTAYVSLPVRHTGLDTRIKDALVDDTQDWRGKLMDRLRVYQTEAPHYAAARKLVGDAISGRHETLAALNTAILKNVCGHLGIATPIEVASALPLDLPEACAPGEWALHIAKQLGATEYRNAVGGVGLFDPDLYARHGIALSFHEHRPRTYATGSFDFVADLSVIDWLMWNDRDTLAAWLA